jgi:hypothetical protein
LPDFLSTAAAGGQNQEGYTHGVSMHQHRVEDHQQVAHEVMVECGDICVDQPSSSAVRTFTIFLDLMVFMKHR